MLQKFALFRILHSFLESDEEESIRSAAKKAKVSASSAKACVDFLLENKILKKTEKGNRFALTVDNGNVLTNHLKICFILMQIQKSGIIAELTAKFPEISSIVLYGSCAAGKNNSKSDIDLLIVTRKPIKISDIKSEKSIKNEVSIMKYTYSEWKKKATIDKPFYDNVIIGGISLYGDLPVVR